MGRFNFSSQRRFSFARRKPNNKGLLGGLNLGLGLLIGFASLRIPGAESCALIAIPFVAAAWFVLREKRLGMHLSYLGTAILGVLSIVAAILSGKLLFGLLPAFAVYFIVRQIIQFDSFLEQQEFDREQTETGPISAKEKFQKRNP